MIDTTRDSLDEAADRIVRYLAERNTIRGVGLDFTI